MYYKNQQQTQTTHKAPRVNQRTNNDNTTKQKPHEYNENNGITL